MNRMFSLRVLVASLLAGAAVFLLIRFDAPRVLQQLMTWVQNQGVAGIVVFIAVYILATVLFIPGSILTLGAGAVFGVVLGTIWVSIGSTLGAFAAFLVGRYVARDWVAAKAANNPRFRAIDEAVGREGWKIVFLTRNSPVFPFNLSNYAYGLTAVPAGGYLLASWIGMLPGTVMYVYLGSLAASLATLGTGEHQTGIVQWILYGVGFLATVAVTVIVTRIARKALRRSLHEEIGHGKPVHNDDDRETPSGPTQNQPAEAP